MNTFLRVAFKVPYSTANEENVRCKGGGEVGGQQGWIDGHSLGRRRMGTW